MDVDDHEYFCPKYNSTKIYSANISRNDYGIIYPKEPIFNFTGNSLYDIIDCSNKDTLCLREALKKDLKMAGDDFIYAIPRQAHVGQEYVMEGTKFSVKFAAELRSNMQLYAVTAEHQGESGDILRYKFYIRPGVGITDLFFEKLYATWPWAPGMEQRVYTDVTCRLVSKTGLLHTVKIRPWSPPAGNKID
ncbi:hypothetical protein [Nitrospirillum sp. BR 11163]|uniref:hypothetical protein n=1 Tax=Nitrospirillum sp. BR 11163 TaxID=3104323 RepID=UPI002AFE5F52|nr:hypothetical protein [Nitrospirillum sp. BR 11163]MEA1676220.1 hypothetical protein [Nitrospirillum sp. BR 11163]